LVSAARRQQRARFAGGVDAHLYASKENLMGKMVAAIIASMLVAASFVNIASAGWSW
jgi:hypothetical protein